MQLGRCLELAKSVDSALDWMEHRSRVAMELKQRGAVGGYLCIADETGFPLLVAAVGEVPPEKSEKYRAFCEEKARRLAGFVSHGHRLSRESRNPDKDQWGGAVLFRYGILGSGIASFSGLPEELDEMLMLLALDGEERLGEPNIETCLMRLPNQYADLLVAGRQS